MPNEWFCILKPKGQISEQQPHNLFCGFFHCFGLFRCWFLLPLYVFVPQSVFLINCLTSQSSDDVSGLRQANRRRVLSSVRVQCFAICLQSSVALLYCSCLSLAPVAPTIAWSCFCLPLLANCRVPRQTAQQTLVLRDQDLRCCCSVT